MARASKSPAPQVGIVMGSQSDWETLGHAASMLREFGVGFEAEVVSAHRTPDRLWRYGAAARKRGLRCIIAGAGGAAHLPGMMAALTTVPVLGVPVASRHLKGMDSLLSIVQMPRGVPVATFAIGEAGAANAGHFAALMLGTATPELQRKVGTFRATEAQRVKESALPEPA